MFEPLAIGRCTLKADVSDDSSTRKISGTMGVNVARGSRVKNVTAPTAITTRMYQRARGGRSRSKSSQVYFSPMRIARRKRGRPPKFGRPGQVVALTLPEEVVAGLRRIDRDVAWAVVRLYEKEARRTPAAPPEPAVAELVRITERRSLIIVNRAEVSKLPGVTIVPVSATRAFLALAPGLGMSDLELAVSERLDDGIDERERKALTRLRAQVRRWRRDRGLRFHTRAIIEVE